MLWLSLQIAFVIAIAAVLARASYLVARHAASPLRNIPGPLLAKYTRFWWVRELARGHFERTNIELHRQYGKIVRIAPNVFSIDDPDALNVIYNSSNPWVKSLWYSTASPPGTSNNFTTQDNKDAAHYRRNYAPVFSWSSILGYEPYVDSCGELLIQKLKGFAKIGKTVDLTRWMMCFAFDVQGEITFSKRFGFLDNGEDIGGINESLDQRLPYAAMVGVYPEWHPTAFKIVNWLAGNTTGKVDYAINYTLTRINERKNEEKPAGEGPPDMLTKFITAHKQDPEKFNDWDILIGAYGNIVAGADTTHITLNAAIYYLLKYPKTLEKLREEIDDAAKASRISSPITFKEAQELPYLQAVVKESQRLFPATALPLWRLVPAGGANVAGRYFPEGSTLGINQWVAHRNREVWSPDPETFRPERWLEEDKEKLASINRYFIPFGAGPRTCQGLNVALLEMSKIIPELVRNFDFKLDEKLKHGEWKTVNNWLIKQFDFKCTVKLRS